MSVQQEAGGGRGDPALPDHARPRVAPQVVPTRGPPGARRVGVGGRRPHALEIPMAFDTFFAFLGFGVLVGPFNVVTEAVNEGGDLQAPVLAGLGSQGR